MTHRFTFCLLALLSLIGPLHSEPAEPTFPPLPFDVKPKQSFAESRNWVSLDNVASITSVKGPEGIQLQLKDGARLRSQDVASYPTTLTLDATWQITNAKGAMGIGWIDFSTSVYYYIYEDADKGVIAIQRGNGKTSEVIASYPIETTGALQSIQIIRETPNRDQVQLSLSLNGTALGDPVVDRPGDIPGSTFQIYMGSGNGAEVTLHKASTIPASAKRIPGAGWFW